MKLGPRAGTLVLALMMVACTTRWTPSIGPPATGPQASGGGELIRLYTSVTQATVDAVVGGFKSQTPATEVEVFRAPSGEVAARIATEQREGGVRADVLWLTDPVSMAEYESQALLASWQPDGVDGIPVEYRSDSYWGTRLLNMVIVAAGDAEPAPADWTDLAAADLQGAVAIPDPAFAGSALGALGYFAQNEDLGLDFYRSLKANGAVQVQAPDEVVTGVAEGRYDAGITLDFSVRAAIANGSPVRLVWPASGAVTIYSPIAVVQASDNRSVAESFVEFTLGTAGQDLIATTGWQPARVGVSGGPQPDGTQVSVDWDAVAADRQDLLEEYQDIFGE